MGDVTTMASAMTTLGSVDEVDASDATMAAAAAAAAATYRPTPRVSFDNTDPSKPLMTPLSSLRPSSATEEPVMRLPIAARSSPTVRPWHKFSSSRVQPVTDLRSTSNRSLHR